MKNINVIDLDKTLIPFDSFRRYIFVFIRYKRFTLEIILLIILRLFNILGKTDFKKKIFQTTVNHNNYVDIIKSFSNGLILSLNKDILEKIKRHSNEYTSNVLVTASYYNYASQIADYLGWDCIASFYNNDTNSFTHAYGSEKIRLIQDKYPINEVKYNFCISDSDIDIELCKLFEKSELFK